MRDEPRPDRRFEGKRRVGLVAADKVLLLKKVTPLDLVRLALKEGANPPPPPPPSPAPRLRIMPRHSAEKRVLAPVDHPDPAHCIITGTGLTHLGSASARDGMHKKLSGAKEELTDSLRYSSSASKAASRRRRARPACSPNGSTRATAHGSSARASRCRSLLRARRRRGAGTGGPLLHDGKGRPVRLGFALGNEYSDHVTERQNYLYLAHSKLRHSSIGPEMVVGKIPASIEGMSRILHGGQVIWEKPFLTGEANMSHTLANLEYHHFKYDGFRRPVAASTFGTATSPSPTM